MRSILFKDEKLGKKVREEDEENERTVLLLRDPLHFNHCVGMGLLYDLYNIENNVWDTGSSR